MSLTLKHTCIKCGKSNARTVTAYGWKHKRCLSDLDKKIAACVHREKSA